MIWIIIPLFRMNPMSGKIPCRLSLLLACWVFLLGASSNPSLEYEVKAVYIYKLLKFIEWPPDFFSPGHDAVVIGILGDSPIREALEILKRADNSHLQVLRLESLRDIGSVQVLLISSSTTEPLPEILQAAGKAKCLTISEIKGSAQLGAMINFVIDDEKVKYEVNVKTMKDAGLAISSRALRAAIKVW
jgi:hypothetical protein